MAYIPFRFRRLRRTESLRRLTREHQLRVEDLILPIFVEENITEPVPIESMPGVYRYPEAMLPEMVSRAAAKGIQAIIDGIPITVPETENIIVSMPDEEYEHLLNIWKNRKDMIQAVLHCNPS